MLYEHRHSHSTTRRYQDTGGGSNWMRKQSRLTRFAYAHPGGRSERRLRPHGLARAKLNFTDQDPSSMEFVVKIAVASSLIAALAIAHPAAAQMLPDPMTLLHNSYVEVEGGDAFSGRTKIGIAANGLGSSSQSTSLKSDIFGGALAGYKLTDMISVEAEGVWTRSHLAYAPNNAIFGQGGAVRTYGGLANARVGIPYNPHFMGFGITPYVAGGIGYGNVQYTGRNGDFTYQDDRNGFIWQGKAGVEVKTGRHIAVDLAYRYLDAPEYTTPGAFYGAGYSALAKSHVQAVTMGVKYTF